MSQPPRIDTQPKPEIVVTKIIPKIEPLRKLLRGTALQQPLISSIGIKQLDLDNPNSRAECLRWQQKQKVRRAPEYLSLGNKICAGSSERTLQRQAGIQEEAQAEAEPVTAHSRISTAVPKRPLSPYLFFSQQVSPQSSP